MTVRLKFVRLAREGEFSHEQFDELKERMRNDDNPWIALEPEFLRHEADALIDLLKQWLGSAMERDLSLEDFVGCIALEGG